MMKVSHWETGKAEHGAKGRSPFKHESEDLRNWIFLPSVRTHTDAVLSRKTGRGVALCSATVFFVGTYLGGNV